ncbi:MAG: hypothetical protein ACTSV3_01955 [Candidatus Thorarchaeota archaeon]|nr:MAG: hypothetical protein DRP09_04840 [Candidatus Thorarchaeota archaeon]
MYVKIRQDGALGIGRATDGSAEITLGYGEAHMIAAALEKLAQTARSYKQTYHKTTDVGGGNRIDFERLDDGTIHISGDRQTYVCTEEEVRILAEKLKHLPPVSVAPPSDYVKKVAPSDGICLVVTNGGKSIRIRLPEAAILKTSIQSSINSRFYDDPLIMGQRKIQVTRSSDLKWEMRDDTTTVRFTAYEIEALVTGLHNGILDVLMDLVKGFGSDDISDIRVKSLIQRIEQDTFVIFGEAKNAKGLTKDIVKQTKKILGINELADERANRFIDLCCKVYGKMDSKYIEPLFDLLSDAFVAK